MQRPSDASLDFANRIHLLMRRVAEVCDSQGRPLQRILSKKQQQDSYRITLCCQGEIFSAHVSRLTVLDAMSLDALAETIVHESQIVRIPLVS
jgi:hypothetical protein